jgi:hypothetical protein
MIKINEQGADSVKKCLIIATMVIFLAGCIYDVPRNTEPTNIEDIWSTDTEPTNGLNEKVEDIEPTNGLNEKAKDIEPTNELQEKVEDVQPTSDLGEEVEDIQSTNELEEREVIIDELNATESGIIYLGMTMDEFWNALEIANIDRKKLTRVEITDHPASWHYGNIYLESVDCSFEFNKENRLHSIRIEKTIPGKGKFIPTKLGLEIGDSIEKMEQLYGTEYEKSIRGDNEIGFSYDMGEYTFWGIFKDNELILWSVFTKIE